MDCSEAVRRASISGVNSRPASGSDSHSCSSSWMVFFNQRLEFFDSEISDFHERSFWIERSGSSVGKSIKGKKERKKTEGDRCVFLRDDVLRARSARVG